LRSCERAPGAGANTQVAVSSPEADAELAAETTNVWARLGDLTPTLPMTAPAPTAPKPPQRWTRHRAALAGVAAAAVLLTGGIVIKMRSPNPAPIQPPEPPTVTSNEPDRFAFPPLEPAWLKRFQALSAIEQVKEIAAELQRRNPGFDGQ